MYLLQKTMPVIRQIKKFPVIFPVSPWLKRSSGHSTRWIEQARSSGLRKTKWIPQKRSAGVRDFFRNATTSLMKKLFDVHIAPLLHDIGMTKESVDLLKNKVIPHPFYEWGEALKKSLPALLKQSLPTVIQTQLPAVVNKIVSAVEEKLSEEKRSGRQLSTRQLSTFLTDKLPDHYYSM